jgi:hypothetical protein
VALLLAVFDPTRADMAGPRARLGELLAEAEYAAARRSTLNARYTDAAGWAGSESWGSPAGVCWSLAADQ